jgi:sugar lactone lactonase YvrE
MKRGFAVSVFAALWLAAFSVFLPRPAADEAPPAGTIVTVVGTGQAGSAGDGGKATEAQLRFPRGLAFDAAGNLFIAEFGNSQVRKVSADGIISTVAGIAGEEGFSGDNGPATQAKLWAPRGITVDGAGHLFIADRDNHRVRKVSPDGIITTVVGTGKEGFSGDGGPATEAQLRGPYDVAVDAAGNLLIVEEDSHRVRKVSPDGIITTVAGTGKAGFSGDAGPAKEARLDSPHGVAVDAAGNLFIADTQNHRVRKVDTNGIITTVAGSAQPGFGGDGGPATAAQLDSPDGLAVDTAGNLFIADLFNHRVRKVNPEGIITTVAGSDRKTFSSEGGPATEAGLRGPYAVAVDAAGNLYISDSAYFTNPEDNLGDGERVLKVFGAAAPGLLAGRPFPKPSF